MTTEKNKKTDWSREGDDRGMIEGIIEGSPDAVGIAVIRLNCGCRKLAAIAIDGEPASKIIAYRDKAKSICDQCKKDHGDFMRVTEQFISWVHPEPEDSVKKKIIAKVLGTSDTQTH